ncbi:hypothetical protein HX096_15325 [Empedobacter falsenii]|uniref:hypothetical protein n=1 Tax=Empedobacter falsenii TaxID=343874 RepID=UPI0025772E4B|nr:hypothetical protein [Empedobacter falsenii]MDM1549224.1 hypothetical protein [Empedobacter falsenii]
MKKILLSIIVLSSAVNAQVALSTNVNNDNLILDSKQSTTSTKNDKTFVLPRNAMKDRKDKTNVDLSLGSNLQSGLLIYNTNTSLGNDKGPYFWYNYSSSLGAWTPFVSTKNEGSLTNLANLKNYPLSSTTDIVSATNNPTTGPYANSWQNNLGDLITDASKRWQVLPNFTQEFQIYNSKNIIFYRLTGFVEAYSSSAEKAISYDVGIFVDGKLTVYSPFSLAGNSTRNCMYNVFSLTGLTNDLSNGKHTIQVAVKNRNILNSNATVNVTYNSRNSNCGTSSTDGYLPNQSVNEGLLSIKIQENPSILNN